MACCLLGAVQRSQEWLPRLCLLEIGSVARTSVSASLVALGMADAHCMDRGKLARELIINDLKQECVHTNSKT